MALSVVAVLPCYPPASLVGAWLTTHEYLADLVERGHDVAVIDLKSRVPYVHEGVDVLPFNADPRRVIGRADVVITHLGDLPYGSAWARKLGKPLVRMVHGAPFGRTLDVTKPVRPDLVVYCSHAVAREWHAFDGRSVVIHPPVVPARYEVEPGDSVTLVNLSEEKGGVVFWSLVDAMPGVDFLGVVGGYGKQVSRGDTDAARVLGLGLRVGPNVSVLPTQADMREVYGRTRVLLMPSAREAYGRVALEAACSGIPTIAHPTDGLREAMGDAATWVDRDDLAGWQAAITELGDPDAWQEASDRARIAADKLDTAGDLARFETALKEVAA